MKDAAPVPRRDTDFFYYRDHANTPVITIARVVASDGKAVGYGWAITAEQDQFCYQRGRNIARGRAIAAFTRGVRVEDGVWRWPADISKTEALRAARCNAVGLLSFVYHGAVGALPKPIQPWEYRRQDAAS